MSRALPPTPPMSRVERQRLRRERAARAQRAEALAKRASDRAQRAEVQRLLCVLREQAAYLTADPRGLANCPEMRDLIATARDYGRGHFQVRGGRFSVKPGPLTCRIYEPRGHLVSFWDLP